MGLQGELAGADFGDKRLSRRLVGIAEQIAIEPDASFPVAAGNDAALEATDRFLNNRAVSPNRILAPHIGATREGVAEAGPAIVAHDTPDVEVTAEHADGGWLDRSRGGFRAPFALAITADGTRQP